MNLKVMYDNFNSVLTGYQGSTFFLLTFNWKKKEAQKYFFYFTDQSDN